MSFFKKTHPDIAEIEKLHHDAEEEKSYSKKILNAAKKIKELIPKAEAELKAGNQQRYRAIENIIYRYTLTLKMAAENLRYFITHHPEGKGIKLVETTKKLINKVCIDALYLAHTWQSGKDLGAYDPLKANEEMLKIVNHIISEERELMSLEKKIAHLV